MKTPDQIWQRSGKDLLDTLESGPGGLTSHEAARRLERYGPNAVSYTHLDVYKRQAYGHSLVCNPWGEILTDCGEGEAVRVVDLDLGDLARYRAQIPILSGRRTDLYRTKQQT